MGGTIIGISYLISKEDSIMPANIAPPKLRVRSRMAKYPEGFGETNIRWDYHNNTSFIEMFAHTGTHIDAPFHIDPKGLTVDSFDFADFVFEKPMLLELPKGDLEKITKDDLVAHKDELDGSDLLLVYTGFSKYRKSDPDRYEKKQPGFSVEAAEYLVENFPSIRAIGVDLMGIENIGEARPEFPVHRVLLGNGRKFFHMEDANLAPLVGKKVNRAYIVPPRFKGAEAMPVTAFAEVEE